jgi:hypothetical protein
MIHDLWTTATLACRQACAYTVACVCGEHRAMCPRILHTRFFFPDAQKPRRGVEAFANRPCNRSIEGLITMITTIIQEATPQRKPSPDTPPTPVPPKPEALCSPCQWTQLELWPSCTRCGQYVCMCLCRKEGGDQ